MSEASVSFRLYVTAIYSPDDFLGSFAKETLKTYDLPPISTAEQPELYILTNSGINTWSRRLTEANIPEMFILEQNSYRTIADILWYSVVTYENMPIQIYWKFYHQKMKIFRKKKKKKKKTAENIDCGYSLEPPWQGGSNE